ncbi:MAG: alpha/beta hydrolase fold domain-containing protein [Streptosporangiaceae bacterium]|nr:alpha/beta hydrolase fold domain-containing protein [Streptosporangiaceae bacterium]
MNRYRTADMQLRGNTRPLPVRVYWPGHVAGPAPLLVFCTVGAGAEMTCRRLSAEAGFVVLSVACDPAGQEGDGRHDGTIVLEWAAEHAAELGGDPERLLVAGEGPGAMAAAAVALEARRRGWPAVTQMVLTDPVSWPADR